MSMVLNATTVTPLKSESNSDEPRPRRRGTKRLVLLFAVLAGALAVGTLTPVRHWLADAGRIRGLVQSLGFWIYPVGTLAIAALVACGVPRLLLCTVAGAAFANLPLGFWRGLLVGEC